MPLSQRKLGTYQRYYGLKLEHVCEFDNGTGHPVVWFHESYVDESRGAERWVNLICPCDLTWKWKKLNGKRTLVHTGDGFKCSAKEHAREFVRNGVRASYRKEWENMSLANVVLHIYKRHREGNYLGEHNPGMLYVQDVERLLGTMPETHPVHLGEGRDAEGNVVSQPKTLNVSFPSKEILDAVHELKKRKLIDLNGMILVPYQESFHFPAIIHHQFAYWIEEPLGWPNGDAGDFFMYELYEKIAKETGWAKGEDVFGDENLPDLSQVLKKQGIKVWLSRLDFRLTSESDVDKSVILREIPLEQWIAWLNMLREEIRGK